MNQKLRHALYYLFVAVVFIPFSLCVLVAALYEHFDRLVLRVRRWAFPEKYGRLPRVQS